MSDRNLAAVAFGGKKNPKQVLVDALSIADTMKGIVVVALMEDDELLSASSSCSALTRLGMLDYGKFKLMESMHEPDDDDDQGDGAA